MTTPNPGPERDALVDGRDLRAFALVATSCVVLALALGVLWSALAPRPVVIVVAGGYVTPIRQGDAFIGADGWFTVITGLAGAVVAVAILARSWRADSPRLGAVLGAVVGGAVGAITTRAVGQGLGAVDVATAVAGRAVGDEVTTGLILRIPGLLLVWPITTLFVVLIIVTWRGPVDRAGSGPAASSPSPGGPSE